MIPIVINICSLYLYDICITVVSNSWLVIIGIGVQDDYKAHQLYVTCMYISKLIMYLSGPIVTAVDSVDDNYDDFFHAIIITLVNDISSRVLDHLVCVFTVRIYCTCKFYIIFWFSITMGILVSFWWLFLFWLSERCTFVLMHHWKMMYWNHDQNILSFLIQPFYSPLLSAHGLGQLLWCSFFTGLKCAPYCFDRSLKGHVLRGWSEFIVCQNAGQGQDWGPPWQPGCSLHVLPWSSHLYDHWNHTDWGNKYQGLVRGLIGPWEKALSVQ